MPSHGQPTKQTTLPELVVSDLDGTLLRSDGTVSAYTRDVLARVEQAGVTLLFATGRPIRWLCPVGKATGHRGLAICSNGAVVYDLHHDEIVERHPLAPRVGRAVVEAVAHAMPEVVFGVELGDAFRHEAGYPVRADYGRLTEVERLALFEEPVVKLLIRHGSHDSDELLAKVREIAGDVAEFTHSGERGLLEVSAHGVSKAATLAVFAEERGIDAADVLAFGDMPNDLGMLAWAGTSYAPTSAHPAVRAAVTGSCPSNDEDGVATVLASYFP